MQLIKNTWGLISGAAIVTGTAVGAGMIAIPTANAGLWYWRSLVVLVVTWIIMMITSLMILEAGQGFEERAHFPTMVKTLLGRYWAALNSFSLAFVLYILVYAYITVGGDLTGSNLTLMIGQDVPLWVGQLIFFAVLGLVVWLSHHWVARFNAVILGGLILTFFMATGGLLPSVKTSVLLPATDQGSWQYIWLALPVALTAFGYHINVPTLRIYLHNRTKQIAWAMVLGSFCALLLYVLWQTAVQGNLPRDDFAPVIAGDGQVSVLIEAMSPYVKTPIVSYLLGLFTYFAIATSFLGVALGLFEFIGDFFNIDHSVKGRFKIALIAFVGPLVLCLWKPNGFVSAIGYAGVALTIWSMIIPALMVYKTRQQKTDGFKAPGGFIMIVIVIAFAALNILAKFLSVFALVPVFTG